MVAEVRIIEKHLLEAGGTEEAAVVEGSEAVLPWLPGLLLLNVGIVKNLS